MKRLSYENLDVYRLAEELADAIWEVVLEWDHHAKSTVGQQIVRAADSIGANIAEGAGSGTPAEHRRFIRIARRSLYETRFWLRRAYRRQLQGPDHVEHLSETTNELAPRLNAYLKSIGRTHEPEVPYDASVTGTHETIPQAAQPPHNSERSERPTGDAAAAQQRTQ